MKEISSPILLPLLLLLLLHSTLLTRSPSSPPSLYILTVLILPLPLPLGPPPILVPPLPIPVWAPQRQIIVSIIPRLILKHIPAAPSLPFSRRRGGQTRIIEDHGPPPSPSAAVGWNVGNSFSRHAPRHHLPGETHHLAHGICHLEEGGDQSGRNWRERGPPRRIGSLSAHISPFKTFPQSRTDLVGSRLIVTNHHPLVVKLALAAGYFVPSHLIFRLPLPSKSPSVYCHQPPVPCQAFIAAGFDWMLIIKLIKCVTNLR